MTTHFLLIMDHARYGRYQPEIDLPVTRDTLIEQIINGEFVGEFYRLLEVTEGSVPVDISKTVEAELDAVVRHADGTIKRTDPSAEHRLTARELGVGAFA